MKNMTDWAEIGVYLGMGYFILKLLWDIYMYRMKRKGAITDTDHEEIHNIKLSITEIRECQKAICADIRSMKVYIEEINNNTDKNKSGVRNIEEGLRIVALFHDQHHRDEQITQRLENVLTRP